MQPSEGGLRDQQPVIICAGNKAGFERRGERQLPADGGEELCRSGIGGSRSRCDGQVQRQLGPTGYADLGADEPGRLCRKDRGAAYAVVLWAGDRYEKIGRAGIAVIANSTL